MGHDAAIRELCHAMVPRKGATGRRGRRAHKDGKPGARAEHAAAEVECFSDVSTSVSEGGSAETPASNCGAAPSTPQESPALRQQRPSAPARDRTKTRIANQPLVHGPQHSGRPAAPVNAPSHTSPTANRLKARDEAPYGRKYDGKGKGLSNFQRIEVGIEDDPVFRVVQRLIGPKGRHMQDIITQAKGAKVWIIGRGSRSWEDNEGPLMVCVGAMSRSVFEVAVGLVRELLAKVRKEHSKFHRG